MNKKIAFNIIFMICVTCFSQSTTKIIYSSNLKITQTLLDKVPVELRKAVQVQYESLKYESVMNFDESIIYFESLSQQKEAFLKGKVELPNKNWQSKREDLSTSVTSSNEKYSIDFKKNKLTEQKNGKLISSILLKSKWKLTTKTKKILGYNCLGAKCKYKNQEITAYFTKEIPGRAIPLKMSFSEGVILEYSSETRYFVATSVLFNQPTILDFFKNK